MIDFARIKAKAGDGGHGGGSFAHIKGKRRGKADGGDGGNGGNVYFEATGDLNTLERFRYVKEYKAKDGVSGLSQLRRGADAEDLIVKVPMGTRIKTERGDEFDLTQEGDRLLAARCGQGGRGNAHLRDDYGRRPLVGEAGTEGETVHLEMELKLIADVGLIGLPNAGKSTLISKLTHAKPKIAAYPFTTLEPNLGVGEFKGRRIVYADIPGLIEGASEGKGLGDLFLRHIERTKILVHLVDVTSLKIWDDYKSVRDELSLYSKNLAKKSEILILNKIDLVDEKTLEVTKSVFKQKRKKVICISAANSDNLIELNREIVKKLF